MRTSHSHLLAAAVLIAFGAGVATPASAQFTDRDQKRSERRGQSSVKKAEEAPLFPLATRVAPEAKPTQPGIKKLQEIGKAYEAQQWDKVLALAPAFAASTSNAYEKAAAFQYASAAASEKEDLANAEIYLQGAIDANGLDNNNHYRALNNLAAIQAQRDENDKALATLDRLMAETKTTDEKYLMMRAGLLSNLGKYLEASAAFQDLWKKHPDDKRFLMNSVATLQQADKFTEANALLLDAHKRGLLTEAKEYRALYSGLLNDEKWREAAAVIDEGVAKGVLPKDHDLAKAYSVVANRAYFDKQEAAAIKYYQLGAPLAADGEVYLNLAKMYSIQGKKAEARAAAQEALKRGVKNTAEAKRLAEAK